MHIELKITCIIVNHRDVFTQTDFSKVNAVKFENILILTGTRKTHLVIHKIYFRRGNIIILLCYFFIN